MKSHFLQILLAVFVVLAISQALSVTSPEGVQRASAGPPPTPTPTETPTPIKTTPDTYVPPTKSVSAARAQSFIQSVGPGALRPGFESVDLNPNDDGSTGQVDIGFPINFFGTTYTQLYVNNNGNVTFAGTMGTYTPFNIVTTGTVIIAPFFADVDTSSAGQPTRYGAGTVGGRPAFGATWRDVDYFSSSASHTNRNHFQLLLIERSDVGAGDFDIEFNYDQIQWEAGTASGSGSNGLGGSSARAGYSNGSAAAFELPGSGVNGAFLDSNAATGLSQHSFNSSQMGRYVYQVRGGVTAAALTTDTVNLNTGTSVEANVTLQNVPALGLGSYSMVVHFNPAVVAVDAVGDGDAPFGAPTTKIIDNTAGTVTLADSQSGATPSGTIVLARLNLHGIGDGTSALGVTGTTLTDAAGAAMGHVVTPGVATVNTPVIAAASGSVVVGSSVDIPVSVQGLVNQSLAGYNITISFDKTQTTVNSVAGGPAPFGSPTSTIDNTAGTVALSQTVAGGFPTGNVTLASLNVQGVAVGASNFSIAVTTLTNSAPAPIAHTVGVGAVNVTPPHGQLHHIVVSPASPSLVVGGGETFTAQGYDAYDDPVAGLTFAWSCTNATAGSINATTGAFTAGTVAGSYPNVVVATSGAVSGNASVAVTAGPLHHITVSPSNPSVAVTGSLTFTVTTYDMYDNARTGDTIVWSVGNPTAGSINATTGAFTAGTVAGSYSNVVVATSGAVTGNTSVTVTPGALHHITVSPASPSLTVGGAQTFTTATYDQYNNARTGDTIAWSVSNATAGSINATTGAFTAGTVAGTYPNVIVASSGTVIGNTSVTVTPGALHHITVSPASPSLTVGGAQTFTAATYDQYNNARTGDAIVWSVGNATAGSINASTGAFTAGTTAGTYDNVIHATSGAIAGTASVTVVSGSARLPGDVNNDGSVDTLDLVAVAAAFGSVPASPNWNAAADLNSDGTVNVFDLVLVGLNFGRHS